MTRYTVVGFEVVELNGIVQRDSDGCYYVYTEDGGFCAFSISYRNVNRAIDEAVRKLRKHLKKKWT